MASCNLKSVKITKKDSHDIIVGSKSEVSDKLLKFLFLTLKHLYRIKKFIKDLKINLSLIK